MVQWEPPGMPPQPSWSGKTLRPIKMLQSQVLKNQFKAESEKQEIRKLSTFRRGCDQYGTPRKKGPGPVTTLAPPEQHRDRVPLTTALACQLAE